MADPTTDDVRKHLAKHGHGFQYAVLRRVDDLLKEERSHWRLEAAELPVGPSEKPIHIDFVLRHVDLYSRRDAAAVYMVGECKRADPARAHWCFCTVPNPYESSLRRATFFQAVEWPDDGVAVPRTRRFNAAMESCNLAFELRSPDKGDGVKPGNRINEATTQVLRGLNGLLDEMFLYAWLDPQPRGSTVFVPAIFTTATLYVVTGDLGEAELATGHLPEAWGEIKPVPWLWYTYNQSRALQHHVTDDTSRADLAEMLSTEYARTIAVVSPTGINSFLGDNLPRWLRDN